MTTTIRQALELASTHWDDRRGGPVMNTMATRCAALVGLTKKCESLSAADGVSLLAELRSARGPSGKSLSPKSVQSYYGAFKRALALSGVSTALWPNAPIPPRRTRDKLSAGDIERLIEWFRAHRLEGYSSTADLAVLLRATGLRIDVEALDKGAVKVSLSEGAYDTLHVTGKGEHERLVPVVDASCRELLRDKARLMAMRELCYSAHLKRWKKGTSALGVTSRLPTPHAVRHFYASELLEKSGGNIAMVQELLGHSDPATTARYLHVDLTASAKVLAQ